MPIDPKIDDPEPEWVHDQQLNFSNTRAILQTFKKSIEESIEQHKRRLSQMVGARDSMRR